MLKGYIEYFESNSSILKIKGSVNSTMKFSFRKATFEEMLEQLKNLDPRKASPQKSIPPKILGTNDDLFCFHLVELFNKLIEEGSFPNDLKNADVSWLVKKSDNMYKKNYRPIGLLPAISKLFERLLYNQLYDYMRRFFSPVLGRFRQRYSTQHVLLNLLQCCMNNTDNNRLAGTLHGSFKSIS